MSQVLQLQSATTQPQSKPVDYPSGIEAMILAILQQTNVTQVAQQAQLVAMQIELLNAMDSSATYAQLTSLYSAYLAEALAANSNLTALINSEILKGNSSTSLLPVSLPSACPSYIQVKCSCIGGQHACSTHAQPA